MALPALTSAPSDSEPFLCQDNGRCGKFLPQRKVPRDVLTVWQKTQDHDQMAFQLSAASRTH